MHSQTLEASDEEADYLQDPSSDEVEVSSWRFKDPLTETSEHFTNTVGIDIARKDLQECQSQHIANNSSMTVELGGCR
jgi:hypothetical protein